jgi:hypothetical protein
MLYGWKAGAQHYWCGARDQGNVWHFDKPARNDLHPTMKPVALVEREAGRAAFVGPHGLTTAAITECNTAWRIG